MRILKKRLIASAIIPAFNEAERIERVIRRIERHPMIDDVIVVSDGSTDDTVRRARRTSAVVVELPENKGKGMAMEAGVRIAKHDLIVFFDADLIGLTESMITKLVESVASGAFEMFTLIRDRKSEAFQLYLPPHLAVGGERAITRRLWNLVPDSEKVGFGIEMALNYYAKKHDLPIGYELAVGLGQVPKEVKRGFWKGLWMRLLMTKEAIGAYFKLHLLRWD